MGAYTLRNGGTANGKWVDAFWTEKNISKVVDVTGAGNSFLGGLAAGLSMSHEDIDEAVFYAAVSASFTIEQPGLPIITRSSDTIQGDEWNGDNPRRRLAELRERMRAKGSS